MCGIMGYVRTAPGIHKREIMEELMKGIERRGKHAAGMACIGAERNVWGKAPGAATKFLAGHWWKSAMLSNPRLLIGHARFATHGDPNHNINNHPFVSEDGRYMIIHNGVIRDDVKVDHPIKSECDSEFILRLVEEQGIAKTFEIMREFTKSSYAVMMLDSKLRRLYVWRNEGNPIVAADLTKTVGAIVMASTEDILRGAMIRAKVPMVDTKIYSFDTHHYYWFPYNCASDCLPDLPGLTEVRSGWFYGSVQKGLTAKDGKFMIPDWSIGFVND